MPKYLIAIQFETEKPLPMEAWEEVANKCAVQLETLNDGTLESSEEKFNYKNVTISPFVASVLSALDDGDIPEADISKIDPALLHKLGIPSKE